MFLGLRCNVILENTSWCARQTNVISKRRLLNVHINLALGTWQLLREKVYIQPL